MIPEQVDVIRADCCTKQLTQISQRVMQVVGRTNLVGVDNPADPDLLQIRMILQEVLEIDGVDQGSFAIRISIHFHGSLDVGQGRTGA